MMSVGVGRWFVELRAWRLGRLARGTLAMTAGMGLRTLGQGIVFLIVARVLGVEAYGAYSAVLALAMTIGGFVGLGASMIMLRDTARDAATFAESWGRTLTALLVTAPPLLLVYCLLAQAVLPRQAVWVVIVCIGAAEILLAPLALTAMQAYQGHERIGRAARLTLAPVLPRLAAALLIVLLAFVLPAPARLPAWAVLYLLAAASAATYALKLLRRDLGVCIEFRWHGLGRAIREGWPFSATGATQKVYTDIDKVMLARLSTLEATGAYSAAYRVVDMASVPLFSLLSAAAPRFFHAGSGGTRNTTRYALRILPLPLAYALAAGTAFYMLAGLLPWLLGAGFLPAVEALRWLAWLPLLTTVRRFMHTAFGSSGKQHTALLVVVCGAVLNVALNIWAIPVWGWQGAVGTTYAAELAMTGLLLMAAIGSWRGAWPAT